MRILFLILEEVGAWFLQDLVVELELRALLLFLLVLVEVFIHLVVKVLL